MKKFTNGEDVVLTMTERELTMMKMLITSGIIKRKQSYCESVEQIDEYNKLRNSISDYE